MGIPDNLGNPQVYQERPNSNSSHVFSDVFPVQNEVLHVADAFDPSTWLRGQPSRLRQDRGFLSHRGTPESSILLGFCLKKSIHFGVPPRRAGNPQMFWCCFPWFFLLKMWVLVNVHPWVRDVSHPASIQGESSHLDDGWKVEADPSERMKSSRHSC